MTSMQGTPGINLGEVFNSGINSINQKGQELQGKMADLMAQKNVSPEDMMAIQFEMGQYNAMLESLSSITKSLTDSLKSVAQRSGG